MLPVTLDWQLTSEWVKVMNVIRMAENSPALLQLRGQKPERTGIASSTVNVK